MAVGATSPNVSPTTPTPPASPASPTSSVPPASPTSSTPPNSLINSNVYSGLSSTQKTALGITQYLPTVSPVDLNSYLSRANQAQPNPTDSTTLTKLSQYPTDTADQPGSSESVLVAAGRDNQVLVNDDADSGVLTAALENEFNEYVQRNGQDSLASFWSAVAPGSGTPTPPSSGATTSPSTVAAVGQAVSQASTQAAAASPSTASPSTASPSTSGSATIPTVSPAPSSGTLYNDYNTAVGDRQALYQSINNPSASYVTSLQSTYNSALNTYKSDLGSASSPGAPYASWASNQLSNFNKIFPNPLFADSASTAGPGGHIDPSTFSGGYVQPPPINGSVASTAQSLSASQASFVGQALAQGTLHPGAQVAIPSTDVSSWNQILTYESQNNSDIAQGGVVGSNSDGTPSQWSGIGWPGAPPTTPTPDGEVSNAYFDAISDQPTSPGKAILGVLAPLSVLPFVGPEVDAAADVGIAATDVGTLASESGVDATDVATNEVVGLASSDSSTAASQIGGDASAAEQAEQTAQQQAEATAEGGTSTTNPASGPSAGGQAATNGATPMSAVQAQQFFLDENQLPDLASSSSEAWGPNPATSQFSSVGPSLADFKQGSGLGNCSFLSWLGALTLNPAGRNLIESKLPASAAGQGKQVIIGSDHISINDQVPVNTATGQPAYNDATTSWVSDLEQGAAKEQQANGLGGYSGLDAQAPEDALGLVTTPSDYQLATVVTKQTNGSWAQTSDGGATSSAAPSSLAQQLLTSTTDYTTGNDACMTWTQPGPCTNGLTSGHAYAVCAYDPNAQTVTLFDPWGSGSKIPGAGTNGTFTIPLSAWQQNFVGVGKIMGIN